MKKINLSIFFSLLGILSFAQSVQIVIKQDGKVIEPVNAVYELKKSTFLFEITSTNLEGFLVGATADEGLYEEAVDYSNMELAWFQNTGMAEGLYNEDKELYLMDYAPSYWYYTDENDHRFDRDPVGNTDQWTGTRTINRFYDLIKAEPIEFKDMEGTGSVYMLIYDPIYNDDYNLVGKNNMFHGELRFID